MIDYRLSHPLYLDVDMMISFLAYLEGGVVFEGQETLRTEEVKQSGAKGAGKVKLPSVANLFGAEGGLEGSIDRKLDSSSEYQAARHHTAASLFNYLFARLSQEGKVSEASEIYDASKIKTGQLVHASGRYLGNPLEEMLQFFMRFFPQEGQNQNEETKEAGKGGSKRSGNPANRAQKKPQVAGIFGEHFQAMEEAKRKSFSQGMQVMRHLEEDIANSPVHDLLMVTPPGLKIVLTASSQYYSGTVNEFLKSGDFSVLGKVTRILQEEDSINLARRTAMGARNDETTRDAIIQAASFISMSEEQANPIISAPAIQILPMAIFI